MHMKKHGLGMLVGGFMVAASTPAFATSLVEMTFEDIVAESSVVLVGEAAASRVEQTADGVVTVTTFNVEDAIVGDAGGAIDVVTPGGVYESRGLLLRESTADAPVFLLGGEAMLFLAPATGSAYGVVGFNQGAVKVVGAKGRKSVRLPGSAVEESVSTAAERIRAEKASPKGRGQNKTD
ncbi:MAG: hypothetical protein ABL957_06495 [Parvularculaceae bacterium]